MNPMIGIDLGNTKSCVAVFRDGHPVVACNSEGELTTPSVVAAIPNGDWLVGQPAKRQAVSNPENTVFSINRLIGRRYDSAEVRHLIGKVPYRIVEGEDGDAWVRIQERNWKPADFTAMILRKMKQTAEACLEATVHEAVLCLPAFFNDLQKAEVRRAAKSAGLDVMRIYGASTAGAVACSVQTGKQGEVAVVDLGGGSLSISILEIGEGIIEVRSTNGSACVGGDLFDEKIMEYAAEEFRRSTHIDLSRDPTALLRLRDTAESARCSLTTCLETEFSIPFVAADATGPKHLNLTMKRPEMEGLLAELIARIDEPCRAALCDAGIKPGELGDLVLIGGSARMPQIQQKVREGFGLEPRRFVGSDGIVAAGAALLGAIVRGDLRDKIVLDVTPLSTGVERPGGGFEKVIEKNTTLPTRKTTLFFTTEDNQASIAVHVLQGEAETASQNQTLFAFDVAVPPGPRGSTPVEIAFDIDANGLLRVRAADKSKGKEIPLKMRSREAASAAPGNGRCHGCGSILITGDRFCGQCGSSLA
jgi:molecular chaperone DnaK